MAQLVALLCSISTYQLAPRPQPQPATAALAVRRSGGASMEIDSSILIGGATLFVGLGGGIGLIALTENAGKRNDALENAQPCVVCKSKKVVTCTICQGTGTDPLASLVKGVREMTGEEAGPTKVMVDDWDSGPRAVVMYEDILSKFPIKVEKDICENCDGRGVVVCDNCQGTGIQPRFLERYSPDDFMD